MAYLKSEYREIFIVDAPLETTKERFSDIETIAQNYSDLERWKVLDSHTLQVKLAAREAHGFRFQGFYVSRYDFIVDHVLQWRSGGEDDNTDVSGRPSFAPWTTIAPASTTTT